MLCAHVQVYRGGFSTRLERRYSEAMAAVAQPLPPPELLSLSARVLEAVNTVPGPKGVRLRDVGKRRDVCTQFSATVTKAKLLAIMGAPISSDLRRARALVVLQELRQSAEYNLSVPLTHAETLRAIEVAEDAFAPWSLIISSDEANVFLAAPAFGKRWDR